MTEFMRGRRLRTDERLRRMVQETHMNCSELIDPMFVMDGQNWIEKIPSMYGQNRYTVDRMGEKLEQLLDAGVNKIMLFGIPEHRMRPAARHMTTTALSKEPSAKPKSIIRKCV